MTLTYCLTDFETMHNYQTPGIYRQEIIPAPIAPLLTGVPLFLGYASSGPINTPQRLTLWPQFVAQFGAAPSGSYLADAVHGFFENEGLFCYVLRLDDADTPLHALNRALNAAAALEGIDLLCAPDLMRTVGEPSLATVAPLQRMILDHCQRLGDRFAILDALPTIDLAVVENQRRALTGDDGALYYPWIWTPGATGVLHFVPPCGHIAGAYARSDQRIGVHKAPANEEVMGVLDLRANLNNQAVGLLYSHEINCLQALPGRGIRIWGARTLSAEPEWRAINVRRVFLTINRWLQRFMEGLVLEPNDIRLWVRILRELSAYLEGLFQIGALKGRAPGEAFYVKCDSETNPPSVINAGQVVTQIGLALAAPAEFVVVRMIHGAGGVTVSTSA